jgi:DNA-binding MarR family transcriptional regulator
MAQGALQTALGVVKSTMSEALAKMEKLGLVARTRRTRAGRDVILTDRGRTTLEESYRARMEVDDIVSVGFGAYWEPDKERLWVLALERLCKSVRRMFGERRARRLYDWLSYDP